MVPSMLNYTLSSTSVLRRFFNSWEYHDFGNRCCSFNPYNLAVINFEKKPTVNAV